jgi:hypothetical protein
MYAGTGSTHYSCQILIKPEFSQQIFKKSSNTKFHGNTSSSSRDVPYRQTYGQSETWWSYATFHNFVNTTGMSHLKKHYCNCLNLAAYCHITCNIKKIYAPKKNYSHTSLCRSILLTQKNTNKKDVYCRNKTWKKCQFHCYSICKVSDFNQINFLPQHIMQILSHLGETQPAVTTAHRITHG